MSGPEFEELRGGGSAFARLAGYIGPVPVTVELVDGQRRLMALGAQRSQILWLVLREILALRSE